MGERGDGNNLDRHWHTDDGLDRQAADTTSDAIRQHQYA